MRTVFGLRCFGIGINKSTATSNSSDVAVEKMCQDLLAKSPSVIRALKLAISSENVLGDDVIPLIVESLASYFGSAEQREATTAFAEKRDPDFSKFRTSL